MGSGSVDTSPIRLSQAGARVAITYRSHEPDAELIAAIGSDAVIVQLDATSETEVAALARTVAEQFDTLDVPANNVGGLVKRATLASSIWSYGEPSWRSTSIHLLVTRALLLFITRGRGRVINIASLAGHNGGGPGASAYATSKAAMFGFTRAIAREVAAGRHHGQCAGPRVHRGHALP